MDGRLTRRVIGALKAGLGKLDLKRGLDPRRCVNRRWSLRQLLTAVLAGLCAGCHNLAQVEEFTLHLSSAARKVLGLGRRVPDTTMRDLLVRMDPASLRGRLWQQIRQAHRQKALRPVGFPFGVVALDGKGTAIDSWEDGYAQRQVHSGPANGASGLVRTFTCSLLSSVVPVCIEAAPIPPETNEDGHFKVVVDVLLRLYGLLDLFRLIVADAGSCSLSNASHVRAKGLHYLFTLNEKQPTLFGEAKRLLAHLSVEAALAVTSERIRGGIEERALFLTTEMENFLDWTHLVTVFRVQRTRWEKDGTRKFVHNRYFICSRKPDALKHEQWLALVRRYWAAVEDGCHQTLDTAFEEDDHPWITGHDRGALNVMILRRIALNLVALFRSVTQRSEEHRATPWAKVLDWFRYALLVATPAQVAGLRPRSGITTAS